MMSQYASGLIRLILVGIAFLATPTFADGLQPLDEPGIVHFSSEVEARTFCREMYGYNGDRGALCAPLSRPERPWQCQSTSLMYRKANTGERKLLYCWMADNMHGIRTPTSIDFDCTGTRWDYRENVLIEAATESEAYDVLERRYSNLGTMRCEADGPSQWRCTYFLHDEFKTYPFGSKLFTALKKAERECDNGGDESSYCENIACTPSR